MNYETYDTDKDDSDENYFRFVEWLENVTVSELSQAKGNTKEEKKACLRYFKRGYQANLTGGELIDFLGVSYPSILDRAGYSDEESSIFFEMSDALTQEEIENFEM